MALSPRGAARSAGIVGALVLAAAISGASCGGGDSATPPVAATGTFPPAKVATIPAGAAVIDQVGLAFAPNTVTIAAGATVYFKNSEAPLHTVDIDGTNISGNMRRGDVVTWTFPKPGQFKVTCDFHFDMHATINVQ